jgi:hypothetical protein
MSTVIPERWRQWADAHPTTVGAIIVGVVAALCFANSIANGYTFDDGYIILGNPIVTGHDWFGAFAHLYWPPVVNGGQYRPLVIASFIVDWLISGGWPFWYHTVNVAWHVAASVLTYRLLTAILPRPGALAGALLFAVHPVHVEAVSNIVGRSELMMAVGVLAALLAHRRQHWSAIPWYAMAMLSKESGIVFFGLAVLNDVMLTPGAEWRQTLGDRRWLYAGYLAVVAGFLVTLRLVVGPHSFVTQSFAWNGVSAPDRWLTMLGIVPEYVRLLAIPYALRFEYGPTLINVATGPTLEIVLGVLFLLVVARIVVATWTRAPVVAAGFLWFVIAISPVSNVFFPSGIMLAERTMYLPSVGAVMIAGWLVVRAMELGYTRAMRWAMAVVMLGFVVRSVTRTPVWHDNKSLFVQSLIEEPESYHLHIIIAVVFAKAGQPAEAESEYRIARTIYKRSAAAYAGGAEAALIDKDQPRAAALLDSVIALSPTDYYGYMRLAEVREMEHDWSGALVVAKRADALAPD